MARTRKSRPKVKAALARPARKRLRASRKAAGRPPADTAPPADPLDDFVQSAARVLALPLEPQWLAAIKANLAVNMRLAELVAEFALPDEAEPAPIFRA